MLSIRTWKLNRTGSKKKIVSIVNGLFSGRRDNADSFRRQIRDRVLSLVLLSTILRVNLSTREIDVGGRRDVTREHVYAKVLYYEPSSTPPYKMG